ncbi:hypothetical protein KP509_23G061800 [Ceratopteris richardii]|uniref:Protein SPT2 homolog n=1 Tax=Ceratopteris richardii TaxID=49495 RepID=A0A8T2S0E5_CERRI|nr:hypothetical protein KP509_23G061800 [Ceratopteris richardii]KAH7302230.1 hypothetical protein KP509_23G061800 [Ceratopteris richardii]
MQSFWKVSCLAANYDNGNFRCSYGSFFGPSEPVVAKRIIYEVRAREMASKVVARQAQEVSDIHKASKASSVTHSDTKPMEVLKQSKAANEAAIRLQKLKEARDYSFLFTDEDPSASPRKDETRPTTKERQDSKPTKPVISSKEKPNVAPRMSSSGKPVAPLPQKSGMGGPRVVSKAHEHTASDSKSKTSERSPSVVKAKVASQSVSGSNVTKISSGPGRPAQSQQNLSVVSKTGSGNGKKPSALSVVTGSKISALKGSDKQSVPSTSTKQIPGKGVPLKSTPVAGLERKLAQTSVSKGQISAALPDQKRPGVAIVGQGSSLKGHYEQKRPPHPESLTKSKPVLKPPPKTQKRPRNANPFLDDDDDAGDVSSMIRKMFGYNPNKYRDLDDEDDRMMEANFHTIQMEEKRSARIAREEDERELALIEEEERRERELAKKTPEAATMIIVFLMFLRNMASLILLTCMACRILLLQRTFTTQQFHKVFKLSGFHSLILARCTMLFIYENSSCIMLPSLWASVFFVFLFLMVEDGAHLLLQTSETLSLSLSLWFSCSLYDFPPPYLFEWESCKVYTLCFSSSCKIHNDLNMRKLQLHHITFSWELVHDPWFQSPHVLV